MSTAPDVIDTNIWETVPGTGLPNCPLGATCWKTIAPGLYDDKRDISIGTYLGVLP